SSLRTKRAAGTARVTNARLRLNCDTAGTCAGTSRRGKRDINREGLLPRLSIGLGLALIIVGVCGYVYVDFASVTALIPAFIGIAFVGLGWIGTRPAARKHAMHAAAALA